MMTEIQGVPDWATVKLRQRIWFVSLIGLLVVPVGLLLLWLQPVFKRTRKGTVAKVPIWEKALLTAAYVLFFYMVGGDAISSLVLRDYANGMPICTSKTARDALTEAFDGAQFARQQSLSVVDVSAIADRGMQDGKRLCSADIELNNAETVSANFDLEKRPGGKFFLSFEIVDRADKKPNSRQSTAAPDPKASSQSKTNIWLGMVGKHPYSLLDSDIARHNFADGFDGAYDDFLRTVDVASNTELIDGRFIVGHGCAPHLCGDLEGFFAIDVKTGALEAFVFSDNAIKQVGQIGSLKPTPNLNAAFDSWRTKF